MRIMKKIAVIGLVLTMTASTLAGCGSGLNGKQTVTTVNGEKLPLGVLAYYVKYQQVSMSAMFGSMMGQLGSLFDTVADKDAGTTIGSNMVTESLDLLERLMVVSQHASDYGVELTADEKAEIDRVAQTYIDKNDKTVRDKIGASKEDVVRLLELITIGNRMLKPMAEGVDMEVSEEKAAQTSLTVVTFKVTEKLTADAAKAEAQAVLDAYKGSDHTDGNDVLEKAKDISADAYVAHPTFSTNDPSDSSVNKAVMDAIAGLEAGTFVDSVIKADDGSAYYLVRVDSLKDEAATASKKEAILVDRLNANLDEKVKEWIAGSEIKRDEAVLAKLTVTDKEPFTVAYDEKDSTKDAG